MLEHSPFGWSVVDMINKKMRLRILVNYLKGSKFFKIVIPFFLYTFNMGHWYVLTRPFDEIFQIIFWPFKNSLDPSIG